MTKSSPWSHRATPQDPCREPINHMKQPCGVRTSAGLAQCPPQRREDPRVSRAQHFTASRPGAGARDPSHRALIPLGTYPRDEGGDFVVSRLLAEEGDGRVPFLPTPQGRSRSTLSPYPIGREAVLTFLQGHRTPCKAVVRSDRE